MSIDKKVADFQKISFEVKNMIQTKSGYNQTLKWIEEFEKVTETLKIELAHNPTLLQIELKDIEL